MGFTTIFTRFNDIAKRLSDMTEFELKAIDAMTGFDTEKEYLDNRVWGWTAPMSLHNGDIEFLVWHEGRLMTLKQAKYKLRGKHRSYSTGNWTRTTEWDFVKKRLKQQLMYVGNVNI